MASDRDDYSRSREIYGRPDRDSRRADNPNRYGQNGLQSDDDRGFLDRAGDEVRSWFGDDDAERRRERDDREKDSSNDGFDRNRDGGRTFRSGGTGTTGAGGYGQNYGRQNYGSNEGSRASFGNGGSNDADQFQRSSREVADTSRERSRHENDPHYQSWRQQQIEQLDRDYDEYRQQNQQRFSSEFGGWRTQRQSQRQLLDKVDEHMEVVGSDGQHVGKVDKVRGDRIILAKNDADSGGHHHSIPSSWLQSVDDKVTIGKSADDAKRSWRDEERSSAIFGGQDRQSKDEPNMLNKSFSGTY